MPETNQLKQLPAGTTEHQLSDSARKQWWQLSHLWSIRLKPNNYTNQSLMALVLFLFQLPVMMIVLLFSMPEANTALYKLILLTGGVWVAALLIFAWAFSHHLRKIMVARTSDEGLELESLSYKRKIRWLDISAVFPVQDISLAQDEYVVVCKNGELFFLGRELSDFKSLIQKIEKHVPAPNDTYQTNSCVPYGHFDIPMIAVFAIMLAVSFGQLKCLLFAPHFKIVELLVAFLPAFIVAIIAYAFLWYHINRIPQIVRIGKNSVYLKTRTNSYTIPKDQISLGKFGRLLTLKTRPGKFLIFATVKDAVGQKLIEQKSDASSDGSE